MISHICIFVCDTVFPEVSFAVGKEGFEAVDVVRLPTDCIGPLMNNAQAEQLLSGKESTYMKGLLFGSSCITHDCRLISDARVVPIELGQCHELIAPPSLLHHLSRNGGYLVSEGWLQNFDYFSATWGFSADQARKFFAESCRKIIFLETGITNNWLPALQAFSVYTGLPYEVLPIGIDYCRMFVRHHVISQQKILERERHSIETARDMKRSADIMVAFSEIKAMVAETNETNILERMFRLLNILCAPENIVFQRFENNQPPVSFYLNPAQQGIKTNVANTFSFILSLDKQFGEISVINVRFPEYIGHYKDLGMVIGSVTGMAISNARKFELLKQSEKTLAEQASKLIELNAAKDKFFSIISHDLRNPMATLLSFSNLLTESYNEYSEEERKDIIRRFSGLAKKSYQLIDNLLNWSLMQQDGMKMNFSEFNIAKVAAEVTALVRSSAELKQIRIIEQYHYDGQVYADENAIRTVIRNLLTNAIKFTNPGGWVEISADNEGDMAIIGIRDNGVGIKTEAIPNLFRIDTAFSTSGTNKEKGTGLGLILCSELVERNQGHIEIASEPGVGTTFRFSVPIPSCHSPYEQQPA